MFKSNFRSTLVLASTVAALAACGGGGGGDTAPPVSATPAPTPTITPRPTPTPTPTPTLAGENTMINSVPDASYAAGSELRAAWEWHNAETSRCGFGKRAQHLALDQASADHAQYMASLYNAGRKSEYFTHIQSPANSGFTGATPIDRAGFRQYPGLFVTENLTAIDKVDKALPGIFAATYHLANSIGAYKDIGFGVAELNDTVNGTLVKAFVFVSMLGTTDTKSQRLGNGEVKSYPCTGTILDIGYHTPEIPNPFPNRTAAASHPFLIVAGPGDQLTVSAFSITSSKGDVLDSFTLNSANDPNRILQANTVALIAEKPYVAGESYTVLASGNVNGKPFTLKETFSVK